MISPHRAFQIVSASAILLIGSGCSTLVGTVKPIDEKADAYGIADLSKQDPATWERLDPARVSGEEKISAENASEIPDAVYQSRKTAATVSLNSACRKGGDEEDLHDLAQQLTMGMTNVSLHDERGLEVSGAPALQTTVRGLLSGQDVMLRTVVMRRAGCVYDFVFLSPPARFDVHEKDFAGFVASLRVK